jgi:hypothetical protein
MRNNGLIVFKTGNAFAELVYKMQLVSKSKNKAVTIVHKNSISDFELNKKIIKDESKPSNLR